LRPQFGSTNARGFVQKKTRGDGPWAICAKAHKTELKAHNGLDKTCVVSPECRLEQDLNRAWVFSPGSGFSGFEVAIIAATRLGEQKELSHAFFSCIPRKPWCSRTKQPIIKTS
jgi:hypothetical protein